jgi:hypothetical protein
MNKIQQVLEENEREFSNTINEIILDEDNGEMNCFYYKKCYLDRLLSSQLRLIEAFKEMIRERIHSPQSNWETDKFLEEILSEPEKVVKENKDK